MVVNAASDRAVLVSFGDIISPAIHVRVAGMARALARDPIEGVLNIHPAYCSLLVVFDPLARTHEEIEREIRGREPATEEAVGRGVEIPVCYGGEFGPDLDTVAGMHGIPAERVIELHSGGEYTVCFLGFTPGFAYLGGLHPDLATPRLDTPRKRVPAGSVGIAGAQTGVYPFATPGGWRLIGRTPLRMFDAARDPMSLLQIGDRVRFTCVSEERFRELESGS